MGLEPPRLGPRLSDTTFEAIAGIAYTVAGLHLPPSKQALVASRISRRLSRLALTSFEDYLDLILAPGAPERRRMVAALTTNVSTFFREPHHFEALRESILPPLLTRAAAGERVRIWSAGCANGQEAYSIALTLLDMLPDAPELDIRILGTDIDPLVVRTAQLGAYHMSMMNDVEPRLRDMHFDFDVSASTYVASAALRELLLFRELNLHGPWPMPGRFDVIFCRNVVIYFDEAGRNALWSRLQDKLTDGGWLLVGHSERVPEDVAPGLEARAHTIYQLG
ncbi:MAG: protein-glutamate O-methyltransferase CheR [Pseudomonadota bacterium]